MFYSLWLHLELAFFPKQINSSSKASYSLFDKDTGTFELSDRVISNKNKTCFFPLFFDRKYSKHKLEYQTRRPFPWDVYEFAKEISKNICQIMVELIQGQHTTGNTPPYPDSPMPEVRQISPFRSTFCPRVCKQPVETLKLPFPCTKNSLYTKYIEPTVKSQMDISEQLLVGQ